MASWPSPMAPPPATPSSSPSALNITTMKPTQLPQGHEGFVYEYDRAWMTESCVGAALVFHITSAAAMLFLRNHLPKARNVRKDYLKLPVPRQYQLAQRATDAFIYVYIVFCAGYALSDRFGFGSSGHGKTWHTYMFLSNLQGLGPWIVGMYLTHLMTRPPGTSPCINDVMFWLHHACAWGNVTYVLSFCASCETCELMAPHKDAILAVGFVNLFFDEMASIAFNLLAFLYAIVKRPTQRVAYIFYGLWFWSVASHVGAYVGSAVLFALRFSDMEPWMSYFVFIPFMAIMLAGHLHTHNIYRYLCGRFLEKARLADAENDARLSTDAAARRKSLAHVALRQDALRRASHAIIGEIASPRNAWHAKMGHDGERPERAEVEDMDRAELARLAAGAGLDEDEIEDMDHGDLVDYCADGVRHRPQEPFDEDLDDSDGCSGGQASPLEQKPSEGMLKAMQVVG